MKAVVFTTVNSFLLYGTFPLLSKRINGALTECHLYDRIASRQKGQCHSCTRPAFNMFDNFHLGDMESKSIVSQLAS